MTAEVNLVAVLVASLANFIIGMLWYSPFLFGKMWMQAIGKTEEEVKAGSPAKAMIVSAGGALVTSYVLAVLIQIMGLVTISQGLVLGFMLWLGFVLTSQMPSVVYEGRNKNVVLIFVAYQLAAIIISSVILAVWQ
ncbi:MAG: DUF1761 domain-containing protein [bacterium]|nr:DUF1761 domain-containing protein [bacterium]